MTRLPNVLVIMADQMKATASHLYGNTFCRTPALERLAREGTWYRNAVTVQRLTQFALPALLSGRNPSQEQIPTAFDHPDNLFTLLEGVYDIDAIESFTALCPPRTCGDSGPAPPPTGRRLRTVARDLGIIRLCNGVADKMPVLAALVEELGITFAETAYMGDDVNDVECLRAAGLALVPADGVPEARAAADYVTCSPAGRGAVREAAELILAGNGGL